MTKVFSWQTDLIKMQIICFFYTADAVVLIDMYTVFSGVVAIQPQCSECSFFIHLPHTDSHKT